MSPARWWHPWTGCWWVRTKEFLFGGTTTPQERALKKLLVEFDRRSWKLFFCLQYIHISNLYPPVNKHSNGKSPSWIGNTSANGGFSITMLDYRSVTCWFIHRLQCKGQKSTVSNGSLWKNSLILLAAKTSWVHRSRGIYAVWLGKRPSYDPMGIDEICRIFFLHDFGIHTNLQLRSNQPLPCAQRPFFVHPLLAEDVHNWWTSLTGCNVLDLQAFFYMWASWHEVKAKSNPVKVHRALKILRT